MDKKKKKYLIGGLGLAAIIGWFIYYFKQEKKLFFVAATVPDNIIKKLRMKISKNPNSPQNVILISKILKEYGLDPETDHYRVFRPKSFLSEYAKVMTLVYAHLDYKIRDGFIFSKDISKVIKIMHTKEFKDHFCQMISYTDHYEKEVPDWNYKYGTSTSRTYEECSAPYYVMLEYAKLAYQRNHGLYIGLVL